MAQMVKRLPTMQETWVQFLGWKDLLEKKMATHSSILAWKIPWTEEPGRLQSMGSQSQTWPRDFTFFSYFFSSLMHYSFQNPGETITSEKDIEPIDEIHQKLQCCSQHWSKKGPNSSPQQCLTAYRTTNTSKVQWIGYEVLPHPPCSPDLLPIDYHFKHLDNFFQGKCFYNQQEAENAFHKFMESWSTDFYATRIKKLISHWQKCVASNRSYVDE